MYKKKPILINDLLKIKISNDIVFSNIAIDFLSEVSDTILKIKPRLETDIISFGFWCRKKNILNFKKIYGDKVNYLYGRGFGFHVAPSNVPTAFAFSFAFGILSGNSNIIRISSNQNDISDKLTKIFKTILKKKKYKQLALKNKIISYDKNEGITEKLSLIADFRVLWGGDKTVNYIKKIPSHPDCIDLVFPNRYSISLINCEKIDNSNISSLIENFYNDTLLLDQNACSSPKIIFWMNENKKKKDLFWKKYLNYVKKKYNFDYNKSFLKIADTQNTLLHLNKEVEKFTNLENQIHLIKLKKMTKKIENLEYKFGLFLEFSVNNLNFLKFFSSKKLQTLSYFGFKKDFFLSNINKNNYLRTMRRIVPIGRTLEINLEWDGYNIIEFLSKKISII